MKKWKETIKIMIERIWSDIRTLWGVGAVLLIYYLITHALFHAFCPFLIITGVPCAGCGITRAFCRLFTGHLAEAMQYNAAVFIWAPALLYAGLDRYVAGHKLKGTKILIGIASGFSIIYYIYRMMTVYPNGPSPMEYYENNILQYFVPFYNDVMQQLLKTIL